jgi:hypothetical protein
MAVEEKINKKKNFGLYSIKNALIRVYIMPLSERVSEKDDDNIILIRTWPSSAFKVFSLNERKKLFLFYFPLAE